MSHMIKHEHISTKELKYHDIFKKECHRMPLEGHPWPSQKHVQQEQVDPFPGITKGDWINERAPYLAQVAIRQTCWDGLQIQRILVGIPQR